MTELAKPPEYWTACGCDSCHKARSQILDHAYGIVTYDEKEGRFSRTGYRPKESEKTKEFAVDLKHGMILEPSAILPDTKFLLKAICRECGSEEITVVFSNQLGASAKLRP